MKRFLALILTFLMLTSAIIPSLAAEETAASGSIAVYSEGILRASYTDKEIRMNGTPSESGWAMTAKIGDSSAAGAQWTRDTLYLAIRNGEQADLTVTLNGILMTKENATVKIPTKKKSAEVAVSLETLGVKAAYGEEISAKITLGDTVWEGTIVLSSIQWLSADNSSYVATKSMASKSGTRIVHVNCAPDKNQGIETITAGYNFYDKYVEGAANPSSIMSYMTFADEKYAPLADRTVGSVVEFDFKANSMPVYKLGESTDLYPYHPSCGFVFEIQDTEEGAEAGGYSFSIVNTEIGLVFMVYDEEQSYSHLLNKKLGDTFRVGVLTDADNGVTLYIDGEAVAYFANVRYEDDYFSAVRVLFGTIRNHESPTSAADSFDIDMTNLAIGKYYGEAPIDCLSFPMIQSNSGRNLSQYEVTDQLTLVKELTHPHFADPIALTWESSDADVIDPETGKVNRPAENGKLVTLTAKASDGTSKEFEIFVKGLSPTGNVLIAENDIAAAKGAGKLIDVHEFTFDKNHNSIILDMGESKTVNVIALKDGDEVTRLNESMLEIWASEDNKTYTNGGSFKILRAGQYTYLYDFEMTGRYIKVNCTTHYAADSDFIAPLDGMIDAYFEDVFGMNGTAFATESEVTVTNETDTVQNDPAVAISVAEAGVNCLKEDKSDVRFYLGDELLYHYYDGERFVVRVTEIPANGSVTLKVLSGNADAADISNKEFVYESVYGTRHTYLGNPPNSRWVLPLSNGTLMSFRNTTLYENGTFIYSLSSDNGYTWIGQMQGLGSYGFLTRPIGMIQDEESGRIIISGSTYYHKEGGGANEYSKCETSFMYSDDGGKNWNKAEFISPTGEFPTYLYSYCDIIQTSVYDGEDGPSVDYVFLMHHVSKEATEEYNTGYEIGVSRAAFTKDGGKTWYLGQDEIAYHGGEGIHRREMGTTEGALLEAPNGDIVVYLRCQFDGITRLGYAVSHDYGDTWSETILSDVYGTNTQPEMWSDDGYNFMLWAGNTLYGQDSFRRYPMNIGIFYDDELKVIENIQDAFSRTSMQGLRVSEERDLVNPKAAVIGDDLYVGWDLRSIRINNYQDYFFKTKGVYDSFENSTVKYEGWMNDGGDMRVSDAYSTDGTMSMYMKSGTNAVRSIPQVQNGTVSFDLYITDVDSAKLEFEFEAGYSRVYGEGAPIALELLGNKVKFFGSDETVAISLNDGWNHFEFDLALLGENPSASLSVNDGTAIDVPVNAEVGAYATFVSVTCMDAQDYYLDSFLIIDEDSAPVIRVSAQSAVNPNEEDTTGGDAVGTDPVAGDTADGLSAGAWIGIAAGVIVIAVITAVIFSKSKKKSA